MRNPPIERISIVYLVCANLRGENDASDELENCDQMSAVQARSDERQPNRERNDAKLEARGIAAFADGG